MNLPKSVGLTPSNRLAMLGAQQKNPLPKQEVDFFLSQ